MESTSTSSGTMINRSLEWFGDLGSFSWKVICAAITRPFELREIIRQFDEIGSKSLPLVALAGAAIGTVLALETRSSLVRFGAKSMLPAAIVYSIIHEIGSKSLPLVALAGAAIGTVLALETRSSLVRFGAKSMLPAAIVYSIIH